MDSTYSIVFYIIPKLVGNQNQPIKLWSSTFKDRLETIQKLVMMLY
jgi:hypothetical protein